MNYQLIPPQYLERMGLNEYRAAARALEIAQRTDGTTALQFRQIARQHDDNLNRIVEALTRHAPEAGSHYLRIAVKAVLMDYEQAECWRREDALFAPEQTAVGLSPRPVARTPYWRTIFELCDAQDTSVNDFYSSLAEDDQLRDALHSFMDGLEA